MKLKLFLVVLGLVYAAGTVRALAAETKSRSSTAFPTDVRVERGVPFLPPDRKERADLFCPLVMPPNARLPVVVIIHGGGWNGGQRDGISYNLLN